jgi:hypothetical protein
VWKGIVYATWDLQAGATSRIDTYDPVTNTAATVNLSHPSTTNSNMTAFFSLDDRLFFFVFGASLVTATIFEFKLGSWVDTGLTTANLNGNFGAPGSFRVGNDVFLFFGTSTPARLMCLKANIATPGAALTLVEITAPIPAALQSGTTIGSSGQYRLYGFVDTVTTPGSATAYLMFFPDGSATAIPTLFRWVDESTEMVVAASPQLTGASGVPVAFYGGGEAINGLGTSSSPLVTTSPDGATQGADGVVVSFRAYGDPLVVPHGAVTGTFSVGEVATQVPSGATGTILRVGANEVWLTNAAGSWTDTQTFTTAGGSAAQNGAATGGASDKTVEARYFLGPGSTGLGVPITGIATIVPGSVTGGGGAVESGNSIINVTADGRTYSFEWDFLTDGVPQALIDHLELFITRP